MGQTEEKKKIVLAIFAHPDDELACAGTMANHVEAGDSVYLAFLTYGENATTIKGDSPTIKERRLEHADKISALLGVKIRYIGLPDSRIEHNVENGYKVAALIKEIRPNIIITWCKSMRIGAGHPDHRNTADLVFDAINYCRYKSNDCPFEPYRKQINYYTYHDPSLHKKGDLVYTDVSDQIDKIKEFIKIYKEAYGDWPVEDFKFGSMSYHGRIANVRYAEVFERILYSSKKSKLLE